GQERAVGLADVRAVEVEVDLGQQSHALDLVRRHLAHARVLVLDGGDLARGRRLGGGGRRGGSGRRRSRRGPPCGRLVMARGQSDQTHQGDGQHRLFHARVPLSMRPTLAAEGRPASWVSARGHDGRCPLQLGFLLFLVALHPSPEVADPFAEATAQLGDTARAEDEDDDDEDEEQLRKAESEHNASCVYESRPVGRGAPDLIPGGAKLAYQVRGGTHTSFRWVFATPPETPLARRRRFAAPPGSTCGLPSERAVSRPIAHVSRVSTLSTIPGR